jgi:hypothetical protein
VIVNSWRIETDWTGTRRWFWVRLYDSLPALRRSAAKYAQSNGVREGIRHFDPAVACVQRVCVWHDLDSDPERRSPIWPDNGLAGVVRLERENLWTSVVFHEVFHAAAIVYRMDVAPSIDLGDGLTDLANEESFAYIYGELAADMDSGLRKLVA